MLQRKEEVDGISLLEKTSLPSISMLRHRRCCRKASVESEGRVQEGWRGEPPSLRTTRGVAQNLSDISRDQLFIENGRLPLFLDGSLDATDIDG
jgi:hypothetical protein